MVVDDSEVLEEGLVEVQKPELGPITSKLAYGFVVEVPQSSFLVSRNESSSQPS